MKAHLLLVLVLIMASCSSLKKTGSVNNFEEITFGSGGGFTGLTNTYMLNAEGFVYKMNGEQQEQLKRIDYKSLKGISKHLKKIDFEHIQNDTKGNMTYFIEVVTKDYQNKATWSDASSDPVLKEFYSELVKTLN
ncbi:hypothetical protein ACE01N_14615 [Saccharicrinis sp. FJH2]|uniref:hypothetical protein n=1 Tax=Saccharicrinis sp. FJH65 TaxID=3344659 RepID=UPI0035F41A71